MHSLVLPGMAARDLNIFTCFRCFRFTLVHGDFKDLTKHILHFHGLNTSGKSSSLVVCSQNGCQDKFFDCVLRVPLANESASIF
jgi:hypothetical protein